MIINCVRHAHLPLHQRPLGCELCAADIKNAPYVAYCHASGLIEFGKHIPEGAIAFARCHDERKLKEFIDPLARHGYRLNSRGKKIRGSDHLIVPGLPETDDQLVKLRSLRQWLDWLNEKDHPGIEVL